MFIFAVHYWARSGGSQDAVYAVSKNGRLVDLKTEMEDLEVRNCFDYAFVVRPGVDGPAGTMLEVRADGEPVVRSGLWDQSILTDRDFVFVDPDGSAHAGPAALGLAAERTSDQGFSLSTAPRSQRSARVRLDALDLATGDRIELVLDGGDMFWETRTLIVESLP